MADQNLDMLIIEVWSVLEVNHLMLLGVSLASLLHISLDFYFRDHVDVQVITLLSG